MLCALPSVKHSPKDSFNQAGWRLELEADPRHVEILANQLGLDRPATKGVVSPGLKRTIFSVDSLEIPADKKGVYRSAVMRASYFLHDGLDIIFSCKELARHMIH